MKKYIKQLLTFSIVAAVLSCNKLEEEPKAVLTTEQFYKTKADAIAAVSSVYNALNASGQTIYNSLFQIGVDIASDEALAGPRARNANVRAFSVLSHATTNDRVEEIWKQHYAAINRASDRPCGPTALAGAGDAALATLLSRRPSQHRPACGQEQRRATSPPAVRARTRHGLPADLAAHARCATDRPL